MTARAGMLPPDLKFYALLSGDDTIEAKYVVALQRYGLEGLEDIALLDNARLARITGADSAKVTKWDWQGQAKRILEGGP